MSEQEESVAGDTSSEELNEGTEADTAAETQEYTIAELLEERDDLQEEIEALQEERDELARKLKRKAADFENYKKRQSNRSEQREQETINSVVDSFLPVRDNLQRALAEKSEDLDGLREGISLTMAEFDRVLESLGVSEVAPEAGEKPDPTRHEVMLRVESDIETGHVVSVYQSGFERNGSIIRPAQITVSDDGDAQTEEAAKD